MMQIAVKGVLQLLLTLRWAKCYKCRNKTTPGFHLKSCISKLQYVSSL